MSGTFPRCLLLSAALGLLGACTLQEPPQEEAPAVKAPVVAAPTKKATAPTPVKKKVPVIDFDEGGSGGGGWG